ncbi:hypothetical protein GCM10028817_40890 [Spirosoma pomorum]
MTFVSSFLVSKQIVCVVHLGMDTKEFITIDADILGGQPVFTGTRVPVESLFDYLKAGESLDVFLEEFPTVKREQAVALLAISIKLLTANNIDQLYAAAA